MNLISLCFFFTGATALALEVLWSKHLSYFLGNSLYATSTVIGSYMLGLGLGAWLFSRGGFKRRHPFQFYGIIQMAVGLYGAVSLHLFSSTEGLLSWIYLHVHDSTSLFLAARFLIFFFLITAPVTLMGLTLPLLSAALKNKNYEQQGSRLYAYNTLGAVFGSLVVGYFLIPVLGLAKSTYTLGAIDFSIGLIIFLKFKSEMALSEEPSNFASPRVAQFGAFVFTLGFLNILTEVAWYRYLINIFGGSVYAFTNVLAMYLTGLALGSYLGSLPWFRRTTNIQMLLGLNLTNLGFLGLITLYFYNYLPFIYLRLFNAFNANHSVPGILLTQLLSAAFIILPMTLPMGLLFPSLLRFYRERYQVGSSRQGIGQVYALNTLGNVFGSIAAGFFIIPALGFFNSLKLVAVAAVVIGFLILSVDKNKDIQIRKLLVLQVVLLMLLLMRLPAIDILLLNRGFFNLASHPNGAYIGEFSGAKTSLIFYEEGVNVSVAVLGNEFDQGGLGLRVSSKGEAHTSPQGRRHLLLLGQLPMLFASNPEKAAVIGFGAGMTSHSVLTHQKLKNMDVLEFEPSVIHASKYFDQINESPLSDPRTHLILEDGRIHLTYTDKKYDVITTDPISPWIAGSANLYSTDFYQIAKRRLNKDGLVCQWIQLGDFSENSFKTMLNSMRQVFPAVSLFIYSDDAIVIGSSAPLKMPWKYFSERFAQPQVYKDFADNQIKSPFEVMNYFYGDTESIDGYLAKHKEVSNNDNVFLEYSLPFELYLKKGNLGQKIATQLLEGRHSRIRKLVPGAPVADVAQAQTNLFLDEFTDIPEQVLIDIKTDLELTIGEKEKLSRRFYQRETMANKSQMYSQLWISVQNANKLNDITKEISILEKIREFPFAKGFVPATLNLILIQINQNHFEIAQNLITEMKKTSPALREVYALEIKLLEKKGQPDRIAQVIKQAIKYFPAASIKEEDPE